MNTKTVVAEPIFDQILFENPNLARDRKGPSILFINSTRIVDIPGNHVTNLVSDSAFEEYKENKLIFGVDVVITTVREDGTPAVLLSKRKLDRCSFGCHWWVYGGSVPSYTNLLTFLQQRAKEECGIEPEIEGLIGLYVTHATDVVSSTIQACYVGYASILEIISHAKVDEDHSEISLFAEDRIKLFIKYDLMHPYIRRVATIALSTMPNK